MVRPFSLPPPPCACCVQLAGTEAVGDLATTSDTVVDASAGSGVAEVVIGTRKAAAVAGAGGAGAPGDGTAAPKLGATWLNKVTKRGWDWVLGVSRCVWGWWTESRCARAPAFYWYAANIHPCA